MKQALAGTEYDFAGVAMRCILTGADTNGTFCLFENTSHGASATPVHVHFREDETLMVLEGEMLAVINGVARTARRGEAVFLPRGVPHQLKNDSGRTSRYIILCTPSGFENFVASAGHVKMTDEAPAPPTPVDIEKMLHQASQFGIQILPPKSK